MCNKKKREIHKKNYNPFYATVEDITHFTKQG
jgi:hypothetical protein